MPAKSRIAGQTDSGRFYNTAQELRQASGRAVRFYLYLERIDPIVGRILLKRQWIYGHINSKPKGPKKWESELEGKVDTILKKAVEYFRKDENDKTVKLLAVEGWRICEPKIQPRVKGGFKIEASDRSQDKATKLMQ